MIDAFAGTGALGLEALSRGAKSASFIERDQAALSVLRANIDRLKRVEDSHVIAGDATSIPAWRGPPATLMFADAPMEAAAGSGRAMHRRAWRSYPGALVIIETDKSKSRRRGGSGIGLTMLDSRHYGRASLHFLEFTGASPPAEQPLDVGQ